MRGNSLLSLFPRVAFRPIPAGAGEPFQVAAWRGGERAYPRGCGGTGVTLSMWKRLYGLSPRVRGNLFHVAVPLGMPGPIPAGAGEPFGGLEDDNGYGAYPRGCGGTSGYSGIIATFVGLSPRVRGNPTDVPIQICGGRPIPAGAGEPAPWRRWSRMPTAYPRGCGGTRVQLRRGLCSSGLSPRVRGNLPKVGAEIILLGPIPAGAGEPHRDMVMTDDHWAYPRGCGGTDEIHEVASHSDGLSPRVRGNQRLGLGNTGLLRPIPAGAGEPVPVSGEACGGWAYPRGCGGTGWQGEGGDPQMGLSPRVRGNLEWMRRGTGTARPIPAGAGEPDCSS